MAKLWIANVPPDVSEDELAEFLEKYGLPRFDEMLSIPGDGSRPAVALLYSDLDEATLSRFQPRLHDMQWKGRRLAVQVMPRGPSEPK